MRTAFLIGVISAFIATSASAGEFVGKLEFTEPGCEKTGICILKSEFGYTIHMAKVGLQKPATNRWRVHSAQIEAVFRKLIRH